MDELTKAIALEAAFVKWVDRQPSYGYDTTREGFMRKECGCGRYGCPMRGCLQIWRAGKSN